MSLAFNKRGNNGPTNKPVVAYNGRPVPIRRLCLGCPTFCFTGEETRQGKKECLEPLFKH